jgi:type IV pilus assembly protein PilF
MSFNAIKTLVLLFALSGCVTTGGDASSQRSKSDMETAAAYNLQLGIDYFRQGNLTQAKEKLDRSLQQNPKNAQTHMAAGLLYERLNEPRKADQYYSRAIELDSRNGEVLNAYAVFLCRKGDHLKGEQLALQAAANPLYKTPEAAWLNAGMCAADAGKPALAEQYFRKSLAVNQKFASALIQMADLEFKAVSYLPARAFLERFQQVSSPTAESLWLGYRIEMALDNASGAVDYARRLKANFITSVQAKALLESEKKK